MTERLILPFSDVGGGIKPAGGAKLYFSDTGLTFGASPKDTYTDSTKATANENPVTANSLGVFPDIWLSGSYRAVLKDKNDVQIWQADNVNASNVGGDLWVTAGGTPTQNSATTFSVTGDQTAIFTPKTRLKFDDSTTLYGTVISSAYTTSTTVTVVTDAGSLSGSLSAVYTSLATLNDASISADAVSYNAIGTGSISKTLGSILRDTVRADEFATVQDALNAVPAYGLILFTPGVTYTIPSMLTVSSPMTIQAYGATLQFPDSRASGGFDKDALYITSSDAHIRGGIWVETAPDGTYPQLGARGVVFAGVENGAGVAPTYIENCTVKDATFYNWQHTALTLARCRYFSIESNYFHTIGYDAVETLSSNNGNINDNIVRNIHPGGAAGDNAYGIATTLNSSGNTVQRPVSHTITISGNTVDGVLTWEGIDTHGGYAVTVAANTVKNCRTSIAMVAYVGGAVAADDVGCSHCTVTGNTIYNDPAILTHSTLQRGIVIDGQVRSGGTLGQQVIVSGNTLYNTGAKQSSEDVGAIEILAVDSATVSGNSINNSGSAGIVMYSCENMTVNSNNIYSVEPFNATEFPTSTFTFSGNPSATDTVTLNGVTCTFIAGASVINSAFAIDVQIGASAADTITNLKSILDTARDSGVSALIAPNGRLSLCNYTAASTTLTVTYQYPTRMFLNQWILAEASSVITLSATSLSQPSDDQGQGILLAALSGGASPSGVVSSNYISNPASSGVSIIGINQTSDGTVSYYDNKLSGYGGLYNIEGSTRFTCDSIDEFYAGTVTVDMPSIAAGSSFSVDLPYPAGSNSALLFDVTSDRYLEGLVVSIQAATGYAELRLDNPGAAPVNIASTTFAYSIKKIASSRFGDPTL